VLEPLRWTAEEVVDVPTLEVATLGGFALRFAGEPLPPIASRAGRSLLGYLLLHRDRPQPRERLATVFWPELPEARARRRLSHTLWQIQDVLGELPAPGSYLDVTSAAIRVTPESRLRIDAEEFAAQVEQYRPRPDRRGRGRDLRGLEAAVELYGGDLLAGFDDDWIVPERTRLASLHLAALGWLVDLAKGHGAFEDALVYARRLTNHDPLREDAHREVMRLCTLLGRTPEALRQFERCRSVLREELGREPSTATVHLAELIERQRASGERPPATDGRDAERVRLVGRDRERARLIDALDYALGGRSRQVLLEGEAGIGKTRLLEQLTEDARWRGFTVARAACDPGGAWPYLPLAEAIESALSPVRLAQLQARVDPVWLDEVGRIIPQLRSDRVTRDLGPRPAAERLQEAFFQVLVGLTEVAPLLLVIDDVHDIDRETLPVVRRLTLRAPSQRCCVLLSYRSQEVRQRPPVWEQLRALDAAGLPDRLQLAPLSAFGTAELIREATDLRLDDALTARLHHETGGNPLFLLETLRGIRDLGSDLDAAAADLPLPGSIVELVTIRLEGLEGAARSLLAAAAVHASTADLPLLALTLGATPTDPAVGDAALALLDAGLLTEREDGYRFAHDQIRRVVVDHLEPSQRARLHRRVAAALRTLRPDRHRDIARHLDAGGRPREASRGYTVAGRAAVTLHAFVSARDDFERALGLQQRGPVSVSARADLLLELEHVLDILGDRDRQHQILTELHSLAQGDPVRGSEIARRRAWLTARTGRLRDAEVAAVEAVNAARSARARVAALTALGTAQTWRGALTSANDTLARAVRDADGLPEQADALLALGDVHRLTQQYDAARNDLDLARQAYAERGQVEGEARALTALSSVHLESGDTQTAIELLGRCLELCGRVGYRQGQAVALVNLANTTYFGNRVQAALDAYDQAATLFADLGDQRGEAMVRMNAATVRANMLGDVSGATPDAEAALTYFEHLGDHRMAALSLEVLATICLLRDDTATSRSHLDRGLAHLAEHTDGWALAQMQRTVGVTALRDGDPATARTAFERGIDVSTDTSMTDIAVALHAWRGVALLRQGDTAAAFRATSQAVAALTPGVERPYLVWWHHAQAAEASGHAEVAADALTRAHSLLEAALADVPDELRVLALSRVPEHRAIVQSHEASRPREIRLSIAAAHAPVGRRLTAEDLREVTLTIDLPDGSQNPVQHRRRVLADLVAQATRQGAAPTVEDLATALDVSTSTVRRDLQALRQQGIAVATRGSRAS
jgi:DNA-binding SARP family transcriptional activator/tetratricopeptide (TPR) repeat protein/DNA-binding transcriptional ArsR family regulator